MAINGLMGGELPLWLEDWLLSLDDTSVTSSTEPTSYPYDYGSALYTPVDPNVDRGGGRPDRGDTVGVGDYSAGLLGSYSAPPSAYSGTTTTGLFDRAVSELASEFEGVKSFLDSPFESIGNEVESTVEGVKSFLDSPFDGITNAIESEIDSLTANPVKAAIKTLGLLNPAFGLFSAVTSALDSLGPKTAMDMAVREGLDAAFRNNPRPSIKDIARVANNIRTTATLTNKDTPSFNGPTMGSNVSPTSTSPSKSTIGSTHDGQKDGKDGSQGGPTGPGGAPAGGHHF